MIFRFLFTLTAVFLTSHLFAQSSDTKAQFILKSLEFMKWDGAKGEGDFVIGIAGDRNLVQAMANRAIGLKIREKNVLVRPFTFEDAASCNMVYASGLNAKQMKQLAEIAIANKIVVVADEDASSTDGVFMTLISAGDKLRFTLEEKQFASAGVLVSPVFQRLAVKSPR
jgi:hypothetical protein